MVLPVLSLLLERVHAVPLTTHSQGVFMPSSNLEALFGLLERKRPFVAEHSQRVSTYAARLAAQYGLPPDMIQTIRLGALMHDIGKLLVPMRILTKPGRLRQREWLELRSHPDAGLELLEHSEASQEVRDIVLHHHERFDGTGYPDRVAGRSVSWPVRIVSVMDSFDALTSPREYREALSVEAARALIAREAGTRFCPWVVCGLLSLPPFLLEAQSVEISATYVPDCLATSGALDATEAWTIGG